MVKKWKGYAPLLEKWGGGAVGSCSYLSDLHVATPPATPAISRGAPAYPFQILHAVSVLFTSGPCHYLFWQCLARS